MDISNKSKKNKITSYKVNSQNKDNKELIKRFDDKRKLRNKLVEHVNKQDGLYVIEEYYELNTDKIKENKITKDIVVEHLKNSRTAEDKIKDRIEGINNKKEELKDIEKSTENIEKLKDNIEEKVVEAIEEIENPVKIKRKSLEIIKVIIIGVLAVIIGLLLVYKVNNSFREDANSIYVKENLVGLSQKFNYYPAIVISGSMEPAMMTYSISICQACSLDDLQVGDIAVFVHNNEIITHRVVNFTENFAGMKVAKTKGDNNPYEDSFEVDAEMVQGKVIYTFNNTASIIKNYMGTDGQLDTITITKSIIYLITFTGIAVSTIMWLIKTLLALYITAIKKDGYINKVEELKESLNKALKYCEELGIEVEIEEKKETDNNKEDEEHTFYLYEKQYNKNKSSKIIKICKRISLVKEIDSQIKSLKDLEESNYITKLRKKNNKNKGD